MPPIRSMSSSTPKPLKTERTHEENQERAYIAASRRSDRSLEARIESARRASEIHKRRTGRSLRVTEQDVVNEEMYEEEDDDLPMQYRRLTAHMNTNSSDFNRRLAAYLTNHVAMRSALDQAISSSYPQQAHASQQWPPTHNQGQAWSQQTPQFSGGVVPPQMLHRSSNTYHPYAAPQNQMNRSSHSQSPVDTRKPAFSQTPQQTSMPHQQWQDRRPSAPVNAPKANNSTASTPYIQPAKRSPSASSLPHLAMSPALENEDEDDNTSFSTIPLPPKAKKITPMQENPQYPHWSQPQVASPLTTTLPPETQMFFNNGQQSHPNSWYGNEKQQMQSPMSFNQPLYSHQDFNYPFMSGMSQTLAPGALDNAHDQMKWPTPQSASTDSGYGSDAYSGFGSMNFNDNFTKPFMPDSMPASGQLTPADNDWASFINTSSWEDNET